MKKYFYLFAAAAVALASCSSDDTIAQNSTSVGSSQPQEISLFAVNQKATRAAVDGNVFDTETPMQVAAYDVTNTRDFFTGTEFSYKGLDDVAGENKPIWTGDKYWPLSPTYINFLAYANVTGTAKFGDQLDPAVASASKAVITQTDNSSAQTDLMYAIGNGAVTQSGNNLVFPANVPMVFEHAQAWISFYADAYDATSGGKVTLTSITLNGASYAGTYTITHANYNDDEEQSVSGTWTALGPKGTDDTDQPTSVVANLKTPNTTTVPGWASAVIAYDSEGDGVAVGDGLLIVPDDVAGTADFKSFTINYSLDGNAYSYTYTPETAAAANVDQKKHYIFKIVFHLHEIEIAPTVHDWTDQTPVSVPIF